MNCIIVEDEYPARKELAYFIKTFSSIKIIEEFDDSIKALKYIQNNQMDIIFLDISMPNLDGITLGKIIKNMEDKPKVVFITAHPEYAIDAFEVEAFDYILKPYSENRIITAVHRLEKCSINKSVPSNKITLWKNDKMIVINVDDICYCEASERKVFIYSKDDRFEIVSTITDFSKKLPETNFFRCHRSYIVNLDKITEITPWFNNTYVIKLRGIDDDIPVSRNSINDFRQRMGI